jgi:ectoine hydroxylase-related dioxygenase (phytanoyl-CoA dioxygenase family)
MTSPNLEIDGYSTFSPALDPATLDELRDEIFQPGKAGTRCLLDHPGVARVAIAVGVELVGAGLLPSETIAIQAIAFDKTPSANWKVTWHQDVMFPFHRRTTSTGYEMQSVKEGVHFSRPPVEILESLLAVRLHLDRCDASNGPLRVSPRSHKDGVIRSSGIPDVLRRLGDVPIFAEVGEMILMRPLLLHASSKAQTGDHRRVLHLVFHSGAPVAEKWHRAIGIPYLARIQSP